MFDKIKQLNKLKNLQKEMSKEKHTIKEGNIEITINGKLEIEQIKLNPDLSIKKQQEILQKIINQAINEMQKQIARKAMNMPGFGF